MGTRGIRRKQSSPIKLNIDSLLYCASTEGLILNYRLDIEGLLKTQNIEVIKDNLDRDISGILKKSGDKWIVLVNKDHNISRQRYTMAHELAHYCLHRDSNIMFEDRSFFRKGENKTSMEYEANEFAAALLMQEESIAEILNERSSSLSDMANLFGVSLIAMRYRLINLGYKLVSNE